MSDLGLSSPVLHGVMSGAIFECNVIGRDEPNQSLTMANQAGTIDRNQSTQFSCRRLTETLTFAHFASRRHGSRRRRNFVIVDSSFGFGDAECVKLGEVCSRYRFRN